MLSTIHTLKKLENWKVPKSKGLHFVGIQKLFVVLHVNFLFESLVLVFVSVIAQKLNA